MDQWTDQWIDGWTEKISIQSWVFATKNIQLESVSTTMNLKRPPNTDKSLPQFLPYQSWYRNITCIKKKDALLNGWLRHWKSKKLIKILDHFEALENLFHLAPIWYLYLFSFRNGISLSKNVAKFVFAVPLKKMQFSKMVSHFREL